VSASYRGVLDAAVAEFRVRHKLPHSAVSSQQLSSEFDEAKHPRDDHGQFATGEGGGASIGPDHASLPDAARSHMATWGHGDRDFPILRAQGPDTAFGKTLASMPAYSGTAFRATLLDDNDLDKLADGNKFDIALNSSWSKDRDEAQEFLMTKGDMQRFGDGRAVFVELQSSGGLRDVENHVPPEWKFQQEVVSPIGMRVERVGPVAERTMRGPDGNLFHYTHIKLREVGK
jgi:hypothetical protein